MQADTNLKEQQRSFSKLKSMASVLQASLDDLAVMETRKDLYHIDMDTDWHFPNERGDGRTSICIGGAVMSNRLGADRLTHYDPPELVRSNVMYPRMHWMTRRAILFRVGITEALRRGDVGEAYSTLWTKLQMFKKTSSPVEEEEVHARCNSLNRSITWYNHDRDAWWGEMKALVKDMHAERV